MKPEGSEPHYLIPLEVYENKRELIDKVTNGDFNPNAMYNIVFLYTDPKNAELAGTALYGTDFTQDYNGMVTNLLNEIAQEPDGQKQNQMFMGVHSHLREGVWRNKPAGATDPCASKNPLPVHTASGGGSPYPETLELKGPLGKAIFLNVLCGIFTAGSIFAFYSGTRGWYLIFFPICSLVFLMMLIKRSKVTLEPGQITLSNLGINKSHKWNEISNIGYNKISAAGSKTYLLTGDKVIKDKVKNIALGQFNIKMNPEAFLQMVYKYQQDALRQKT